MLTMVFIYVVSSLLLIVTLLPLSPSRFWWVRVCEFPRLHIFTTAIAVLLTMSIFSEMTFFSIFMTVVLLVIIIYQASWLYPYTRLKSAEVPSSEADSTHDVTFMAANVEMSNSKYDLVINQINAHQPDVLFLMETNEQWQRQLQEALKGYQTVVSELKDNCYGCIFATKLPTEQAQIHYVAGDDTPSVHAQLTTKQGQSFIFRGLHPRPPVPGNTTEKRDTELRQTAKYARDKSLPEVVMGDFNNVVWSRSALQFKHLGRYYDPQIGRRCVYSFHARYRLLRLPIDQLYVTKNIQLATFYRGEYIGSDHFPLVAKLRINQSV